MKTSKKEVKEIKVNVFNKAKSTPNYLQMIRLYGAQAVCNMLNNL